MHVKNRTEVRAAYDALSPKRKTQFLYLHGYERSENKTGDKFTNKLLDIYATNGFWLDMWPAPRTGIFNLSSRINHSCVPNATYRWCRDSGTLSVSSYISHPYIRRGLTCPCLYADMHFMKESSSLRPGRRSSGASKLPSITATA